MFVTLPKVFPLSQVVKMKIALWIAMLSVVFQMFDDLLIPVWNDESIAVAVMTVAVVWFLFPPLQRTAVALFVGGLLLAFFSGWYSEANHTWLAVWTLAPIVLFASWWKEHTYLDYIRLTLGVVMVVAALQKVIAGTYFDGSYIAWLSYYGSITEQTFSFLCDRSTVEVCGWFVAIGFVAVLWQLVVGILLLGNYKGTLVYFIEFSFLLFVGYFANEMNFQVLNIALLCMAFRLGMPFWLALLSIVLLGVDVIGVGTVVMMWYL